MNDDQKAFYDQLDGIYEEHGHDVNALCHELDGLAQSYEGNDRAIKDYINNMDVSTDGAKSFTNSIRASSRAMLAAKVSAIALNAIISIGFSAIIGLAVKAWNEYSKRLERATDATTEFKNKIETLENSFDTYDQLNAVLQDETSTTEELNRAKEDLLKLQDSIIDAYGDTAGRIDLVNGKYEEQIKLLKNIRTEEAKAYIRDNKNDLDATTTEMNDNFGFNVTGLTRYNESTTIGAGIRDIASKYDSLSIGENWAKEADLTFNSDVKNAREQLNLIYSDFEELRKLATSELEIQFIDNILSKLSSKMNKWDEKYSAARDAYETYTGYAVYAAEDVTTADGTVTFSDLYEDYLKEVEEFNEAVADGNYELIEQAKSELEAAKAAADSAIDAVRNDIHFDDQQVEAIADAFAYLGENANFATANLKNAEHILRGLTTGEILTHNLTTEPAEEQVQEFVDYYESEMKKAQELGVDLAKTVYGNIDTNSRQILKWTEENVEGFRDALESWSTATDPINADDYLGSYSTVDTRVEEFGGTNIAFTPILNTPNGAVYLDQDTVYKYINTILDNLGDEWTTEEFLKLDAEGFVVNGRRIQNIIADIGETAIATGEAMHFVGSDGSIATTIDELSGSSVITDAELQNIKEMKFSIVELKSYLNSTEGAPYLSRLQSLADSLEIEFDDLLNILVQLGYLADLQTPIGEDDIDVFVRYQNAIEDVLNGSVRAVDLTDAERAAWDRFNAVASERNAKQEDFYKLVRDTYALNTQTQIGALSSANDKLASATEKTTDALEDIETVIDVVNKDMYLTDEEMGRLVSRHGDLADSLQWTEKGWTLEADAMDLVKDASNALQSAYITAQQKMTELCASGVGQRLEMYGVELQSLESLLAAFSTNIGKEDGGMFFDWKYLMTNDDAKEYYEAVKAAGGNINTITGGKFLDESKAVVQAWKLQKQMKDALTAMEEAKKAVDRTSGGSSVEKYAAEIDKLYKALERQKEIEEDIANIQRARESLEEDDYSGRIKSIYEEIDALERLNENLHEQNEIRRSMIRQNISDLQAYGFSVTYNSAYNELLVNNYEELNTLVNAYAKRLGYGTEKTNKLIESVEQLIEKTHELNDANKENSASWQDNTKAVKDFIKEIKNLKLEMVDDYLGKKNDYISHMTDFELWDTAEVSKQLESMLEDLDDFYAADLLSYEEYVERHNEITKRLYDSRKDSLEYIMDMVEDMIRQELEDQVDAYEDQKDALNDIIEAKKKIIELTKEENDYNKSLQDKVKEMAKLQERIAQLELDDSREAAAEKSTLIDQLAELQSEVDSMQYDNSIDKQLEALDEMAENNEEAIDKEIEQIEELADNAEYIHDQTIKYIRDNWSSLLDDLIEFNNLHGDGIDENVTQNWENAYSALMEYKEAAWSVAKDMATGQAVGNTLNPLLPDSGGSAQDVISQAQKAEITNLVNQMRANSAKWPTAGDQRDDLERANDEIANTIEQITGKSVDRGTDGVWYIDGKKLYDEYPVYHTGGTVGSKKKSEVFSLLEQGEDVLNKQQKFTAIPLLQAGIQALNLNENTYKILEALQKNVMPKFGTLNTSEPAIHFAPEINIEVNAGSDAKEIAAATKDAVWSAITDPFHKMGVSSKLRSIKI